MTKKIKQLFLIDGNSLVCRYFYGTPSRTSNDNIEVNAVFSFMNFLINLINKNYKDSTSIVVLFDRASNNFRKKILTSYKQNRPKPSDNFFYQVNLCEEVCNVLNIPVDYHQEYEADDLIASYQKIFCDNNNEGKVTIVTTDKDLMQLVQERVSVLNIFKKKYFNEIDVFNKIGVYPKQIPDFLAICGDSSDNIPGIYKIGEKTAAKLLLKYDNLDNILNSEEGIKKDFKPAILFRQLTLLKDDITVNINNIQPININTEKIEKFLQDYNFLELVYSL